MHNQLCDLHNQLRLFGLHFALCASNRRLLVRLQHRVLRRWQQCVSNLHHPLLNLHWLKLILHLLCDRLLPQRVHLPAVRRQLLRLLPEHDK